MVEPFSQSGPSTVPDRRGTRFLGVLRLSIGAMIALPLLVSLATFLYAWLRPTVSGAGMDASQRPVLFVLLAILGLAGWALGTGSLFVIVAGSAALPRLARVVADPFNGSPEPLITTPMSAGQRLYSALVLPFYGLLLSFFLFLAPMLVGFFLQGGVYEPVETFAVVVMTVLCVAWSAFLLSIRTRRGAGES